MSDQWRACFDESRDPETENVGEGLSVRTDSCFVMAGVIATDRQWNSFYPAWKKALHEHPAIPFYHHNDGGRPRDKTSVFYGWSREEVARKRLRLAGVIREHTARQLVVWIQQREWWAVVKHSTLPSEFEDAYLPAFAGALQLTAQHMKEVGGSVRKKPIIVLDTLASNEHRKRAISVYREYARARPGDPVHEVAKWLRRRPKFLDDRVDDIGLQAADLVASVCRSVAWAAKQGEPPPKLFEAIGPRYGAYVWGHEPLNVWRWDMQRLLRKNRGEYGGLR